jgi:hypothetical protein
VSAAGYSRADATALVRDLGTAEEDLAQILDHAVACGLEAIAEELVTARECVCRAGNRAAEARGALEERS